MSMHRYELTHEKRSTFWLLLKQCSDIMVKLYLHKHHLRYWTWSPKRHSSDLHPGKPDAALNKQFIFWLFSINIKWIFCLAFFIANSSNIYSMTKLTHRDVLAVHVFCKPINSPSCDPLVLRLATAGPTQSRQLLWTDVGHRVDAKFTRNRHSAACCLDKIL